MMIGVKILKNTRLIWMDVTMETEEEVVTATTTTSSSRTLYLLNVATIMVEIEWRIHTNCHPQLRIGNEINENEKRIIHNNKHILRIDPMNVAHYSDQIIEITTNTVVGMAMAVAATTTQTPRITKLPLDGATRRIPKKPNPQNEKSPNVVATEDRKKKSFVTCTRLIRHRKRMRSIDVRYEVRGGRNDMVDGRDAMMMSVIQ
mmetsp:Transcript_547/g.1207  ORF Transcript_547/g.1207 Transcript_547/m.1207 type:complete len:203 (+) Transcript_547:2276-2884(+)